MQCDPGRPSAPALLFDAGWNGTLAAVRDLGAAGVPVMVADPDAGAPAARSRFATGYEQSPRPTDPERLVAWLLESGRRKPGRVLCPTSDDNVFLLSAFQDDLRASYQLDPPPLAVLRELLDKERLLANAAEVGIRAPKTLLISSNGGLEGMHPRPPWPVLLKQRLQVLSKTHSKGHPLAPGEPLEEAYRAFRKTNAFAPLVLDRWSGVDQPFLQEYMPREAGRIYCLSGFIDKAGAFATRASLKLISHPRYLGIGLCFEAASVEPALERAVIDLCRRVGYYGVFQCEFIESKHERLLIDFNPRFYNFMSFDVARGLPQGRLSYLLASGRTAELTALIARSRAEPADTKRMVWIDQAPLAIQLALELAFRRIDLSEVRRWREFRRSAHKVIDPIWVAGDPGPGRADLRRRFGRMARHPRDFIFKNTRAPF